MFISSPISFFLLFGWLIFLLQNFWGGQQTKQTVKSAVTAGSYIVWVGVNETVNDANEKKEIVALLLQAGNIEPI